jgi:hypothetical protein
MKISSKFLVAFLICISPIISELILPNNQLFNFSTLAGTIFRNQDGSNKKLGNLSGFFIENRGQIDREVKYYFHGSDFIYFTNSGIIFQKVFTQPTKMDSLAPLQKIDEPVSAVDRSYKKLAFKVEFIGSKATSLKARNKLPGNVNYFKGNNPAKWFKQIPTYQEIIYPELYSNIDLVYKGIPNGIKYEFLIKPNAKPGEIILSFTGIEKLEIDKTGNLVIKTKLGETKELKPFSYQIIDGKKIEVDSKFKFIELSKRSTNEADKQKYYHGIIFDVAAYNKNYELVIDPQPIGFSTFLGGNSDDFGNGIALDKDGCAYVTGYTSSSNFPTTPGAIDRTSDYNGEIYVAKLNYSGSALRYSTFIGGDNIDWGEKISVDDGNNAYITGTTYSQNFPTTQNAYDNSYNDLNDGSDIFFCRLNSQGLLTYSTFFGGNSEDHVSGLAVYNTGSTNLVFMTGFTRSDNFPNTYTYGSRGELDYFVTKLNPRGMGERDLLYSTVAGGPDWDYGCAIAVNRSGFAFVLRDSSYQNNSSTSLISQLNNEGKILWSTSTIVKPVEGFRCGLTSDDSGIYATGGGWPDPQYPYSYGNVEFSGDIDVCIIKLNTDGNEFRYFDFIGGQSRESSFGVTLDRFSNAYLSGYTQSTDFPHFGGINIPYNGGGSDALVTKINNDGSLNFSTCFGGSSNEVANDIVIEPKQGEGVYITGYTESQNYPTTIGAYDRSYNSGNYDAFITKLYHINIVGNLPDLTSVPNGRFYQSPMNSNNGDRVKAKLKIKNIGSKDAGAFVVKIYLSGYEKLEENSRMMQSFVVQEGLRVNNEKLILIDFVGRINAKRNKFLIAKIDTGESGEPFVNESNENNNFVAEKIH